MQKEVLTQRARFRLWPVWHWRTLVLAALLLLLVGVTLSNYGAPLFRPRTPLQTSQMVLSSRRVPGPVYWGVPCTAHAGCLQEHTTAPANLALT